MNSRLRRVWAVVPAAGRGARFETTQASGPKQYARLAGATVLEWSLSALLHEPRIAGIVVALAADDTRWPAIAASMTGSKIETAIGGASRQESVMRGLKALEGRAGADDWIMVHDAARPCLTSADLKALIDAVEDCEDATSTAGGEPAAGVPGAGLPAGLAAVPPELDRSVHLRRATGGCTHGSASRRLLGES